MSLCSINGFVVSTNKLRFFISSLNFTELNFIFKLLELFCIWLLITVLNFDVSIPIVDKSNKNEITERKIIKKNIL